MTPTGAMALREQVELDMRAWLERAVIGLNLCPFAKGVHVKEQIHYEVSQAIDAQALRQDLARELKDLVAHEAIVRDTTLLMAPLCLRDFLDFNDFLGDANRVLTQLDLEGVIQIASFHPQYQFAGTQADDISNFTNRAPYPTLHLLREDSIARALAAFPQAEKIFERNVETMARLGHSGWAKLGVQGATFVTELPAGRTESTIKGKS